MKKLITTKCIVEWLILISILLFSPRIKAEAHVYVSPATTILAGQSIVTIDFMISNVFDIHSYSVKILFDDSLLDYQNAIRGPFLSTGGGTLFLTRPTTIIDSVEVNEAILGAHPPVNGSGKLFSITLNVLSAGNSLINIVSVQLRDHNNVPIPVTWTSGEVVVPVSVNAKVFLQGPFSTNNMNTNLNSLGYLPTIQPYSNTPWNYNGTENVPDGFFESHPNIVDWVLVELRTGTGANTIVERKAGFITNNGTIVNIDGVSPLYFTELKGNYYLVIYHRNHLAIMSSNSTSLDYVSVQYDFTNSQSKAYGINAMINLGVGIFGMFAADANSDGTNNATDLNVYWIPQNGTPYNYYTKTADFNLDGTINATDLNVYWIPNNGRATQVP